MKKNNRKSVNACAAQHAGPIAHRLKPLAGSIAAWAKYPGNWSFLAGALPAVAMAQLPTGGTVVAGSATISTPDANKMVVQQASNKAIYNWQSFSIGSNGYVQFVQPGSSSIALNRVIGGDPSSILGRLSSNGQIFLVNPNGVFFGANAVVDVAGIVATTMNIRDEDFMNGDYRFFRAPNAPQGATVINQGTLNANGGYVVLAGDYVNNTGVIQAQFGTALLASGEALTMQLAGSSLINYAVDKATVAHLAGVSNAGQILANGGRVIMTADVANDLAATVVNNSGLIEAQSTVERNGAIYLEGNGGSVANSGTLDASAQAGANGGHVEVRASGDINHEAGSLIKVSGADTGESDAGSVYTWADGQNNYKQGASIEARGGAQGGDGGHVELSGNKVVNRSIVDLRAPNGKLGTLTLDPNQIIIAGGSGVDDDTSPDNIGVATIYEQNLENQLKLGDVNLTADGADAGIIFTGLSDGVLDGTNSGSGGSLSLTASGSGTPGISFTNMADTIKVDGGVTMAVDNGAGSHAAGSIAVGNIEAGTSIDLKAGSVSTGNLTIAKSISTSADTSYSIEAHAYAGNLTVIGNVGIDVANSTAAAVGTSVVLTSDTGNVNVSGNVSSNATGLGYYHYNWSTAGSDAPTYYGAQPWTLNSQGDHPITAALAIQAAGNVTTGGINVLATDNNTAFTTNGIGGYWQTATATQHNFWRPTAAQATGSVTATNGNVTINGQTNVKADGYATSDYSEVESWRTMVDNFNYTSGSQTVHTWGCLGYADGVCTGYGYSGSYQHSETDLKGSSKGNYIWVFGQYTYSMPSDAYDSPEVYKTSDYNNDSSSGPMSYTGIAGMKAQFDVTAGGNVTMNGMSVTSVNRSATGNSSYTDANWAHQDTASGLNGTGDSFTSSNRERDYYDDFGTSYTAATSTAVVNITAGDNASVSLNGGGATYEVVSSHPNMTASSNYLAAATMNVTAGTAGSASGNGLITVSGAVTVSGAKNADVSLAMRNYDGAIDATGSPITVTNAYNGADGRATLKSDIADVHLDGVAVSGGRSAYLDVNAEGAGALTIDHASSAIVTGGNSVGTAAINLNGAAGVSVGDVTASSTHMLNTRTNYNGWGSDQSIDGGTASIAVQSTGGDVHLNGDVAASGYKTAGVTATASGAGKALDTASGKAVSATTSGQTLAADPYHSITLPTYSAGVTLTGNAGLTVDSSVAATVSNHNGAATVALMTTGGTTAGITQTPTTSVIKAEGASASVDINAGSATPTVDNAAAFAMGGAVQARGTSGEAKVSVNGASGSVYDLSAVSTGNTATASVVTSVGALTLDHGATVTGYIENGTGAQLTLTGASNLDTSNATVDVKNDHDSDNAVAKATLTASGGTNTLGITMVSTAGKGTAELEAKATGDLSTVGELTAKGHQFTGDSPQTSGNATVKLSSSSGNINLANNVTAKGNTNATVSVTANTGEVKQTAGTVQAHIDRGDEAKVAFISGDKMTVEGAVSALATDGTAAVSLTSGAAPTDSSAALTVNGNIGASSDDGTANVLISTTGGSNASIAQGSDGAIGTMGGTASNVTILAGKDTLNDMTADNAAAFDLKGALRVGYTGFDVEPYSEGTATLTVAGKSGNVAQFTSASSASSANASIMAYNGDLTVTGNGSSTAAVSAAGNASATLEARAGTLTLGDATHGIAVNTSGNTKSATLTADGSAGLNVGGTLSATASNGTSTVDLSSGAGNITLASDITAFARDHAIVGATADAGALTQAADTDVLAGATSGVAEVDLTSDGAMTINGDLAAAATSDGTLEANHTGSAYVNLTTTGGSAASVTQASASTIAAVGSSARVKLMAGDADLANNQEQGAAFNLAGTFKAIDIPGGATLDISGASGTVHDFTVTGGSSRATATITGYNGGVTLDGTGTVTGNVDAADGAALTVSAKAIDARDATLTVSNTNAGSVAGAQADLTANGGANQLGVVSVSGDKTATLNASASAGLAADNALLAIAAGGTANINLSSSSGNIALNGDMNAIGSDDASIDVTANLGSLTQSVGTTSRAGASGGASIDFESAGTMTINGDLVAAATSDGTTSGDHTGFAQIDLTTTGGAGSGITQGSASTISAVGASAQMTIIAGQSAAPGFAPSNPAAAFNLGGTLEVLDTMGGSTLSISGGSGSVHDFTVEAGNAPARATITAYNGNLAFTGAGNVSSAREAKLSATAQGDVSVSNNASLTATLDGSAPFPFFTMMAISSGLAQINLASTTGKVVVGTGNALTANANALGDAEIKLTGATGINVNGNVAASASSGNADIQLRTSGDRASIVQASGSVIRAESTSELGDATVDIQAGDCCKANVTLNGSTRAVVDGDGNATIRIRGNNVTVRNAQAKVLGSGDALLDIAAPASIAVTGTIDVQAANSENRADVKLISDKLTYSGGKAIMSKGNSHVQLASFDTRRVIGVDSDQDFDAEIQTNYSLATLQKFMGNRTEIIFGGEYDRSAWVKNADPAEYCLPGMSAWANKLQQTADIHVAGNGGLDLGDVKMVFDTTGTTYYHDTHMSPWSVPSGRIAIFVARPNVDRYLDRTDNTLQTMTEAIEDAPANSANAGVDLGAPLPGATLIQGRLFMDGDGVNTGTQLASVSGSGTPGNGGANAGNGAGAADNGGGNAATNDGEASASNGKADNDVQPGSPDEQRRGRAKRN